MFDVGMNILWNVFTYPCMIAYFLSCDMVAVWVN